MRLTTETEIVRQDTYDLREVITTCIYNCVHDYSLKRIVLSLQYRRNNSNP
jgi:hypothetical protein